jgi:hypothetical protein
MGREALTSPGQFLDFFSLAFFGPLLIFQILNKKKKKKKKTPGPFF